MTLQTQSMSLALDALYFGHEATPPINARTSGRDNEVKELAASIEAHGMIHPLLVKLIDRKYYVADGNRRLAALQYLSRDLKIKGDAEIKCECDTSDSDAAELSLAANVMREALHPADMYVAFKELSQRNLDEVQIGNRFGVEPARVKKFLALGNIAPIVLDAWRNDDLGHSPIETIRAFTMGPTQEDQVRVFEKLKQSNNLNPWEVGKAFGAGDSATRKALKICGTEAYQAAGGSIVVDLFGENHAIADPQLAQRLADEALVAKQDALIYDGWSWVNFADNLPYSWSYAWEKLKPGKKGKFSAEQQETSGCVIDVGHGGDVTITYGVVKPTKAKTTSASSNEPAQPAMISAALMERLSAQATEALREAIVLEPKLGLIALLAAHMTDDWGTKPIKASHEGAGRGHNGRGEVSFTSAFELLMNKSEAGLFEVAAEIAAAALDVRSQNPSSMPFKEGNGTLAAELDAGNTYVALRGRMDYEDYFKAAPKAFVMQAVTEALNEDEARKVASLKKADLAAFALANVPATGWLPVELRTVHYSGPGAE